MIIDLTMEVSEKTPAFPGEPGFQAAPLSKMDVCGIASCRLTFNSHFSTHIDAPSHMIKGGKNLEDYPIEAFVGKATIVDVRGKNKIQKGDVPDLNEAPFCLFRTDHSKKAFQKDYFKNNPVLTPDAAQALIDQKVKIVGIDSFTPDNEPYTVHKILFKKDILILENLVNLEKIGNRCRLIVAPLNLRNADGAPTRVIAEI